MAMTPLPALDRTSATFKADVDEFFGTRLPRFTTEANDLQTDVTNKQVTASDAATTATTKASEALTSANNAATSKTGADSARDAAVVAKDAAEAALDSFDDRYLGAKATAPTADNDGAALLTGALYWDTALPGMRSWNGAEWVTLPAATAASMANTPAGSIAATTVQAAINELDSEKVAKTDVIAIANGGTGATTANAAADAIGAFRRGTLLGTVSQSAGVPTGAVIERGSNANGEYVRFADGTQICTLLVTGGSFASGATTWTWTFPAGFSAPPHINPRLQGGNSADWKIEAEGLTATDGSGFIHNSAAVARTVQQAFLAVGRWF